MAVSLVVADFERSDHDSRLYFISLFFVILISRDFGLGLMHWLAMRRIDGDAPVFVGPMVVPVYNYHAQV